MPVMVLTNRRLVPGSSTSRFIRAACVPTSGSDANSASLTVMTPSVALIGSNGLTLRPGRVGTAGPRAPGPPGPPGRPPCGAAGAPGAAGAGGAACVPGAGAGACANTGTIAAIAAAAHSANQRGAVQGADMRLSLLIIRFSLLVA